MIPPQPASATDTTGPATMRRVATGMLIAMAALYVATRIAEPRHAWLGYVRAFAEAAMVGGLADWFAVTALFRHPLGLPIPHTAIIPRNKDRIGTALAVFLRQNFLTPSVVARRMVRLWRGPRGASWRRHPNRPNARGGSGSARRG